MLAVALSCRDVVVFHLGEVLCDWPVLLEGLRCRGLGAGGGGARGLALPRFPHCAAGPITWETWQGSEEEAGATAGAECSSLAGKFEEGLGEKSKTY